MWRQDLFCYEVGMDSYQRCVEGFHMVQTSNPSLEVEEMNDCKINYNDTDLHLYKMVHNNKKCKLNVNLHWYNRWPPWTWNEKILIRWYSCSLNCWSGHGRMHIAINWFVPKGEETWRRAENRNSTNCELCQHPHPNQHNYVIFESAIYIFRK